MLYLAILSLKVNRSSQVETEFMLTFLGYNIRKLFRYFSGHAKFNYWEAPKNLTPEKIRSLLLKDYLRKLQKYRKNLLMKRPKTILINLQKRNNKGLFSLTF